MILQVTKVLSDYVKEIKNNCWKGSKLMDMDSKGSDKVLTIIWNPQETVFRIGGHVLHGNFRYLG